MPALSFCHHSKPSAAILRFSKTHAHAVERYNTYTYFLLAPELVELGMTTVSAVVYDVLELPGLLDSLVVLLVLVLAVLVDVGVFSYEVIVKEVQGGSLVQEGLKKNLKGDLLVVLLVRNRLDVE
ncbi:hypothetical protein QBC45DRAFT_437513 [Copromyces sp. CBS 386.78]|nr:hypothetical protein QBC45DRAFT_437513 [Copromyces sp. CBS 386.78]